MSCGSCRGEAEPQYVTARGRLRGGRASPHRGSASLGGSGMTTTTYGWLVLAFPLLGTLITAFGFRVLPGRTAGWIGTGAIFLAFVAALGALISLQGHA